MVNAHTATTAFRVEVESARVHFPHFWFTDFPRIRTVEEAPGGAGRCALPTPCGDAFVSKLTAVGTLVDSWALGGSDNENLMALCPDARGHVYVSAYTSSCDFPVHRGTRLHPSPYSCAATFVSELRLP